MRRIWLQLKRLIAGRLAERSYGKYRKWRDRIVQYQIDLDDPGMTYYENLSPAQQTAIRKELEDLYDDLAIDRSHRLVPFWN